MNNFDYRTVGKGVVMSEQAKWGGRSSCFSSCKYAQYFEYKYPDSYVYCLTDKKEGRKLDVKETKDAISELIGSFIDEFGFKIEWSHKNNTFKFETSERMDKSLWDVYACMILSRFFISGNTNYKILIENIYNLHKYKEYSVFESYILASCVSGYYYFSFTHPGFLDLSLYRKLKKEGKHQCIFIGNTAYESMNNRVGRRLEVKHMKMPYIEVEKIDTEKRYEDLKNQLKDLSNDFIKINHKNINEGSKSDSLKLYLNSMNYYNEAVNREITNNLNNILMFLKEQVNYSNIQIPNYGTLYIAIDNGTKDWFSLASSEDYIRDNAEKFKEDLSKSGEFLRKRKFSINSNKIFERKGMNLMDEINKTNILDKKLKQWKQ